MCLTQRVPEAERAANIQPITQQGGSPNLINHEEKAQVSMRLELKYGPAL